MVTGIMLTSDVSCRLLEVDYSALETLTTGWWIRDPQMIRYGRLGIHAAVTALKIGRPADLTWSDDTLSKHLKLIKAECPEDYDLCKRVGHGTNYGLTLYGMTEQFPDKFPTIASAKYIQDFLFKLLPSLPAFHGQVRKDAKDQGFLGGCSLHPLGSDQWRRDIDARKVHPFGYRHWFWDVLSYQPTDEVTARKWLKDPRFADRIVYLHGRPFKVIWGGDSKRVIANFPQSIGAGILKNAELKLFHPEYAGDNYIGDCYFGRTPLLVPIHDSLFLHIPNRCFDRVTEIVVNVMQDWIEYLPCPPEWQMGPSLRVGVAAKAGRNWAPQITDADVAKALAKGLVVKPNYDGMAEISVPKIQFGAWLQDTPVDERLLAPEGEDTEQWDALRRKVG